MNPSQPQRMAAALERIEASRSQLILALSPEPSAHDSAAGPVAGASGASAFPAASVAARMRRQGVGLGLLRAAQTLARRWWRRQPWHAPAELVASAVAQQVNPLVRRHPWAALAAAAAVGAVLVGLKPWVFGSARHRWAPWRDHLGGMLWSQLGQASVQMAVAGALAAWISELGQRAQKGREVDATPPPPGEAP